MSNLTEVRDTVTSGPRQTWDTKCALGSHWQDREECFASLQNSRVEHFCLRLQWMMSETTPDSRLIISKLAQPEVLRTIYSQESRRQNNITEARMHADVATWTSSRTRLRAILKYEIRRT